MKLKTAWIIFFIILACGIVWFFLNYSSYFGKNDKNNSKDITLRIGIDDQISDKITPIISDYIKKQNLKANITVTGSLNADPFDIFITSEECVSGCEKIGEIPDNKITFANLEEQGLREIFINTNSRYKETTKLFDFLKSKFESSETILVALGDIMLSRNVGTKIFAASDFRLPFLQTQELTATADITFANLESPFNITGPRVTAGMVFKAEPETIEGLKYASIDIVSLANNHFGNQGREGMAFTFKHLEDNGISYTGAGENFQAAHKVKIIEKDGIKFGFLGYTGGPSPKSSAAATNLAGYAWMDIKQLKKDVEEAKNKCDVVIVSMHDGIEYTPNPNQEQIDFARAAIDAGANVVLGHHPHVVQALERYHGGLIFYSLGNFVFDQMWSEETREGVAVRIKFNEATIVSFELIPIKIFDYNQPRVVESKSLKESILNRIIEASNKLNKEQII